MAKRVQLMTNTKEWQTVDGVEVLIDVPQEDLDPITDSSCVEIEGHRTLEETINQENMFTPEIVETKVHSKVGGAYHDNVVDGAYEEAILYGNTQVNLVESITTGSKYIPHSFTSFQGNESKIGNYHNGRTNQVAPLVKGVTMVNLAQTTSVTIAEGDNGGAIENIKSNTKYTLALDFTVQNTQKGFSIHSFKDDTYLETSMIRTGMGEKVKFTFTTHNEANRIYIVNNRGYGGEIQLDNIMVIEGDVTDLDLPFFKGMRSVELSKPLTNLFTDDLVHYNANTSSTNTNGNITTTSTGVSSWNGTDYYLKNLKPHTKYIVMWDSLTTTQTSTTQQEILICAVCIVGNSRLGGINEDAKCPTLRSIIFDTRDKPLNEIAIRIHASMSNSEATSTTVKGLRVFEWDDSLRTLDLQTIGYFSGTKYVSTRTLETEGKNLYPYGDINFTPANGQTWHDGKGKAGMTGDIASKSQTRFLLKKGTYTFTIGNTSNCTYQLIDDKEQIVASASTFNLTQDTYCTIRVKAVEANVATTATNIQIERGETVTAYEAYQGRYYKPRETEEIILRSLPNGVCDTFNLQTGELVQRIGEVVLDGSEYFDTTESHFWYINLNISNENYMTFMLDGRDGIPSSSNFICDKLPNKPSWLTVQTGVWADSAIVLTLPTSIATTVLQLKEYLQTNQLRIQYELKEPIITKLQTYARVYSGQTNAPTSMGNNLSALTYYSSNYYLKVGNLSPVPAILEPITTVPYYVRLKPSTLYTVKYNRGGYSNSMKFDLGGSVVEKTNATDLSAVAEEFTVKTPAILSHEQLILSGTGYAHNFIVVEGDITGTELPYFEGMKDVKMPIVKNIGKNLFDIQSIYQGLKNIEPNNVLLLNDNTLQIKSTAKWHKKDLGKPIKFKENTRYTLSFNAQDINNVGGLPDTIICFTYIDGTSSFNRMWGDNVFTSTAGKTVDYIEFSFGLGDERVAEFSNFMLVEGTETQLYEPYKENSVYAVQGEYPITNEMIEQGGFSTNMSSSDGSYETMKYGAENIHYLKRLRSKDLIPVKPNTTYAFAHSFSKFIYNVYQWNGNKRFIDGTSQKFTDGQVETITTTADTQYIHFLMSKDDISQNITVGEYDWSQFHMYELDSTINLRSLPNGVKDELNLLTGEYIQRVGEVVVDGSGDYTEHIHESSTHYGFRVPITLKPKTQPHETYPRPILCDKLPSINYGSYFNGTAEGVSMYEGESTTITSVYVSFDRNRINMPQENNNIDHVKEYCKTNPLTIQYELAEPITSHVRLVSNNQEREVGVKLPNGVCNTYNPSTGITTVRVGKAVFDGSADEGWRAAQTDPSRFVCEVLTDRKYYPKDTVKDCMLCDKITVVSYKELFGTNGTDGAYGIAPYNGNINIQMRLKGITTAEQLQQYLSQNPITVWYELKYPQIQPDIVLPNGVHDEYNPETGVYTKRVGFAELDGSVDEILDSTINIYNKENTIVFFAYEYTPLAKKYEDKGKGYPICTNQFEYVNVDLGQKSGGGTSMDVEGAYMAFDGNPCFAISKEKLIPYGFDNTMNDRTQVKPIISKYLSQNPLKVWYELATPITYQLTPYFGLPQPYAYEDGYLIHESAYPETTLPPEFKYKLVANRTGQIVQNGRKLQEHTTRLSNLEALIIEATIESLFNRELQLFELELMDIQLIDLGE